MKNIKSASFLKSRHEDTILVRVLIFKGKMEASEPLGAINTNLSHEYGRRDLALLKKVSEEMRCGSSEGNIKTGS